MTWSYGPVQCQVGPGVGPGLSLCMHYRIPLLVLPPIQIWGE